MKKQVGENRSIPLFCLLLCLYMSALMTPVRVEASLIETAEVENTFSFLCLSARIEEPAWQPQNGIGIVPMQHIPKDPRLMNTTGADTPVIASMSLTFAYSGNCPDPQQRGATLSEADMARLSRLIQVDYNADRPDACWCRFPEEESGAAVQHFYYTQALPGDGSGLDTTAPLFTQVLCRQEAEQEDMDWLESLGGFDMLLTGSILLMQENGTARTQAYTAAAEGWFFPEGAP